jgi:hypothetical protein
MPLSEPTPNRPGQAVVALLLANKNRIFRFLMTLVPCRSDVEDLLQDLPDALAEPGEVQSGGGRLLFADCGISFAGNLSCQRRIMKCST